MTESQTNLFYFSSEKLTASSQWPTSQVLVQLQLLALKFPFTYISGRELAARKRLPATWSPLSLPRTKPEASLLEKTEARKRLSPSPWPAFGSSRNIHYDACSFSDVSWGQTAPWTASDWWHIGWLLLTLIVQKRVVLHDPTK